MDFHISQFLSPGRKEFVKGTLLLTGAGLFCRVLGFFYRIYMSRTIGAEGLGLYNMIHPLFSIAFAVCAGSIQTALSQYIAASQEKGPAVFKCGLFLSLSLSVIPLLLLWKGKMFLAGNILSEPQAARYLPVLAVSVPFACLHACINGYYYGMNKAHIPSFSQIAAIFGGISGSSDVRYRYGKYGYGISIGRMAGQTVSGRKIVCTGLPENLF